MELERTFRLSDFYIQKLDDARTIEDVRRIHDDMVLDFTEKMRRILKKPNSKHIRACKEYIYAHIKERITVEDLAQALNSGKVYAAGLDVVSQEPIRADNPLLTAKNCFLTPHIAWASRECRQRIMEITEQNIRSFLDGNVQNRVN